MMFYLSVKAGNLQSSTQYDRWGVGALGDVRKVDNIGCIRFVESQWEG